MTIYHTQLRQRLKTIFGGLFAVITFFVISAAGVSALVTQSFASDDELALGTIVSLGGSDTGVERASSDNIQQLYGVVTRSGDIALNGGRSIDVARDGVVDVLVSTSGGDIASGDSITVGSISGIGEKATTSGQVIGVAQEMFDGSDSAASELELSDGNSVKIGLVQVKIGVTSFIAPDSTTNRNKIQQVADKLAGKRASTVALIIASLALIISSLIAAFLLIPSAHAAMISLGRNPLSEKIILRSLIRVLFISSGIFVIGVIVALIVLRVL